MPPIPSPPRLATLETPRSTTPLARRTRLASCRLRRRGAATPTPGPSSPPSVPRVTRAYAEKDDAATDARNPTGPASPTPNPTATLARPTRHPSTGKKCREWRLQPREPLLIIGDSNVLRFAEYSVPGLQIDGYPGACFRHASGVLAKTTINTQVRKLVLAFGINERGNKIEQA